jgi:hypothetical protein
VAAIDHPRAAPTDFDGIQEPGGHQLISDPARGFGTVRTFSGHIADGPPI